MRDQESCQFERYYPISELNYKHLNHNKNALSGVESRALGVKLLELLYYFFVSNTKRVLYVIMYILKKYKKLQGETGRTS